MATTSFTKKSLEIVETSVEPAVTPPENHPETAFVKKPKMAGRSRKRDIPEGLWTKCKSCSTMLYDKELDENLKVCMKCGYHFKIGSRERVHSLVETCSFEEMDAEMESVDILQFTGAASYKDKLEAYKKKSPLKDAVITGIGKIASHRVGLGRTRPRAAASGSSARCRLHSESARGTTPSKRARRGCRGKCPRKSPRRASSPPPRD